jgi:hypothetical protein
MVSYALAQVDVRPKMTHGRRDVNERRRIESLKKRRAREDKWQVTVRMHAYVSNYRAMIVFETEKSDSVDDDDDDAESGRQLLQLPVRASCSRMTLGRSNTRLRVFLFCFGEARMGEETATSRC